MRYFTILSVASGSVCWAIVGSSSSLAVDAFAVPDRPSNAFESAKRMPVSSISRRAEDCGNHHNRASTCAHSKCVRYTTKSSGNLPLKSSKNDEYESAIDNGDSLSKLVLFGGIGFLYWYWMVLGALVASQGLPGIPAFLPLTPGWPPSMEDLQPALDDSAHFFYLADWLGKTDVPSVQPVRLALFNVAESWIFAFLPALWKDPYRLPRPILLPLWLVLGINLTNAFLAPYLFVTQASSMFMSKTKNQSTEEKVDDVTTEPGQNRAVSALFAIIALTVTGTALYETATLSTAADWQEVWQLVQTDRTYLAFVVDLVLFSVFQPLILQRARQSLRGSNESLIGPTVPLDALPFGGLIAWLLEPLFDDKE